MQVDERHNAGVTVTLLARDNFTRFEVKIVDGEEKHTLHTTDRVEAREMFWHPFFYVGKQLIRELHSWQ